MAIVIKTERVVSDEGELCRKILEVDLLNKGQTPKLYFQNKKPAVALCSNGKGIYFGFPRWYISLLEGVMYREQDFQENLKYIYDAGKNLQEVNAELKKLRKSWNSIETFVI